MGDAATEPSAERKRLEKAVEDAMRDLNERVDPIPNATEKGRAKVDVGIAKYQMRYALEVVIMLEALCGKVVGASDNTRDALKEFKAKVGASSAISSQIADDVRWLTWGLVIAAGVSAAAAVAIAVKSWVG
jgi:hypothetical protein